MSKQEYKNWGRKQCKTITINGRCEQPVTDNSEFCYYCNKLDKKLLEPTHQGIFENGRIVYPKIISRVIKV